MKNNDMNDAISYEASIRYLVEKSNKRAWTIAFCSVGLAIAAFIGIAGLTPLKEAIPYVIRVDNVTGQVDIITSVNEENFTPNEAIDKYFVSQYVKTRQGYYYDVLTQDYELTQIYSSPKVGAEYVEIYEGANARQDTLKANHQVNVNLKSIVLGESNGANTATVRFDEVTKVISNGGSSTIIKKAAKVATLAYEYSPANLTTEDERLKNPLGFKVTTYRIDDEIEKSVE